MARIASKNTKPEILIRKIAHNLGYRFRLHRKDLPGKPDLVFVNRKKIIFVHGCFWHGHNCKAGKNTPKSNTDYWIPKLANNKKRDQKHIKELKKSGWNVLIIWECEIKNLEKIKQKIQIFLEH